MVALAEQEVIQANSRSRIGQSKYVKMDLDQPRTGRKRTRHAQADRSMSEWRSAEGVEFGGKQATSLTIGTLANEAVGNLPSVASQLDWRLLPDFTPAQPGCWPIQSGI